MNKKIETSAKSKHYCRLKSSGALDNACKKQCAGCENKGMVVTIVSTKKIIEFNGVPARVWEGHTDNGIKVNCFITRISVAHDETRLEEFEEQLKQQKSPSPEVQAIPLRLIL